MSLVRLFLAICLYQKGPQDVPASATLFYLMVLAYFAVGAIVLGMQTGWLIGIVQAVVELGLVLGFIWGLLALGRKSVRFQQTATALLGSDTLISVVALPLLLSVKVGSQAAFPYVLLVGLMIWSMAVTGHILRHALSKPLSFGIGLAVLYFLATYQIMAYWFPPRG
jgi:hypothetical protein